MKYRKLGKSDLMISEVGFGCMSLPENGPASKQLIDRAVESGINFFDTADLYQKGLNEIMVGEAIKGKRDKLVIASKVGNQWTADGSGWDWNPRKDYILSCIDKTLQRLQTDYLDLYQLHGGTINDPIDETIDAFEIIKKQGKIRYYGISSIRPNVIREYVKRSNIVSVMMQYSLLDRRPEESCLDLLRQNNIGVLARGALAKGLLVNKEPAAYLDWNAEQVRKISSAIQKIRTSSTTPSFAALRFVLRHPAVTCAVVGIRTPDQLEDIIKSAGTGFMDDSDFDRLTEVLSANQYNDHR